MVITKLPPRTKEEEVGIKMFEDYLDGADYCDGAKWEVTPEQYRLMNLGFQRFFKEEIEEYKAAVV